jgi:hypothetical protein
MRTDESHIHICNFQRKSIHSLHSPEDLEHGCKHQIIRHQTNCQKREHNDTCPEPGSNNIIRNHATVGGIEMTKRRAMRSGQGRKGTGLSKEEEREKKAS